MSREYPHSLEAEAAVLGAMIIEPANIGEASQALCKDAFFEPKHRMMYEAMQAIYHRHGAFDLVMLRDELKQRATLKDVGGIEYIKTVAEASPSAANFNYYAAIVNNKADERRMCQAVEKFTETLYDPTISTEDKKGAFEQAIINSTGTAQGRTQAVKEHMPRVLSEIEQRGKSKSLIGGMSTGFWEVDNFIGGLRPGKLYVIAGATSMGKSSFCLDMAGTLAAAGEKCLIFTLEMAAAEWTERIVASWSRINSRSIMTGRLENEEWGRLVQAAAAVSELGIYIADSEALTPAKARIEAVRQIARNSVKAVFIDYLQLMQGGSKYESRQLEVSGISRQLKQMAMALKVPVIVAAQLNRNVDERKDHRPTLSDLRESGAIEQDADVVLFLYRPDYYKRRENPRHEDTGEALAIIAKNRGGAMGDVKLTWLAEFYSFQSQSQEK